ncbi:hypothetical protein [Candidatus Protochlamydia amoebophila]|uniref:SpoVT-AbrB domain-containing protein n=1 Tax=Protochlamydia amoebophila (strain UWE25) TaxID=264201 RepID=A0A2P9HAH2_PARUW|nr:hypothetical protein [Candidatus Protochlamydia amoebophila]SPJ31971.1 unnamed protein product [Candidatus Protochlamydia amoebophila UWE25]
MRKYINQKQVKLQLDTRNRICLTQFLPKGLEISSFRAYQEDGKIILEPLIEVPALTMSSLMKGIEDIKEGRISELDRDFSEFINDDEI